MVNQENYIFSIQERNFISTKNVTKKNPKINKPTSAPAKNNRFAFQLSLKESYDGRSNFYRETNDNQYLYCFYGLVVLVVCIISCIPISLIPMHDLITDPEYWYELMIIFLPLGFLHSGHIAIAVKTLLNDLNKRLPALIVDLFCTTTLASAFLVSLLHILWSSVWGYLEPFPFRRLIVLLTTTITVLIRVYCVFSKERRSIQGFATRCRAFIFAILWMVVIGLQFAAIRMIGNRTSIEIQWLGVIVVWMVKEMNDFVVGKIIANAATSENIVGAQMWGKLLTNITFSFWIAVTLATALTLTTSLLWLAINFGMNLMLCCKAIRMSRNVSEEECHTITNKSKILDTVAELVLNETIEVLVPVAFIGSFAISYFGPNREILLFNLGCGLWKPAELGIFNSIVMPVVYMALLDFSSAVIAGILLWKFCRINILREYCKTSHKYWLTLALYEATMINVVRIKIRGRTGQSYQMSL